MTTGRPGSTALKWQPLWGAAIGAASAAVYWLAAEIWPTSIAVVLAMLATALLSAAHAGRPQTDLIAVFALLLKFNALMALSASSLPFASPANLALGLIMIAGLASSRALMVSATPATHAELATALATGFAPAALLGLPGLVGLVAAIGARIAFMAYARRGGRVGAAEQSATQANAMQQLTELCFYLGALATWAYG